MLQNAASLFLRLREDQQLGISWVKITAMEKALPIAAGFSLTRCRHSVGS